MSAALERPIFLASFLSSQSSMLYLIAMVSFPWPVATCRLYFTHKDLYVYRLFRCIIILEALVLFNLYSLTKKVVT